MMLQNRQPIIYGDGEQKRCFSDIDDCIYCLDKLMTDKKIVYQIVNIGPDEEFITINDLFKIISNKIKNLINSQNILQIDQMKLNMQHVPSIKQKILFNYKTTVSLDFPIY